MHTYSAHTEECVNECCATIVLKIVFKTTTTSELRVRRQSAVECGKHVSMRLFGEQLA